MMVMVFDEPLYFLPTVIFFRFAISRRILLGKSGDLRQASFSVFDIEGFIQSV